MINDERPSLRFCLEPGAPDLVAGLSIHIPHSASGPVRCESDLTPIAAALTRYKIEAARQPAVPQITIDEADFGEGKDHLFEAAWNFIKNTIHRKTPRIKAGGHFAAVGGIEARERNGLRFIQFDVDGLPDGNITFEITGREDQFYDLDSRAAEATFVALFDFLVGRFSAAELMAYLKGTTASSPDPIPVFSFGGRPTGTTVMYRFPDGLRAESIDCAFITDPFQAPAEIELLIGRANQVLRSDAPGIWAMPDQPMLAPREVKISMIDPDSDTVRLSITLADSSYRYYAAFAFADRLSRYRPEFLPLAEFVRQVPDPSQPAPASCSVGVRVLLETADARLIVSHRSDRVKMNPDVWSVSANEGVRKKLLEPGRSATGLLKLAADKAALNELRIKPEEHEEPLLLSLYRNEYNQWGAGFWMSTALTSIEVINRQPKSIHHWEHGSLAALPLDVGRCGRAMRDLGIRWYGGALETICTVLSWREMASGRFVSPEEIGMVLSRAGNDAIVPIDEVNATLLPAP